MAGKEQHQIEEISVTEREALHEVELGIERLHRAHGHLVAFHHNTGRAMNHLAAAEDLLHECDYHDLADALRDEYLPRGVVAPNDSDDVTAGQWSYEILENFQETFMTDLVAFGETVHATVGENCRHAFERHQEREWKQRARRD